jgi:methylglyoxal synthase
MKKMSRASERKIITLIAHDNKKQDLLEQTRFNLDVLRNHAIFHNSGYLGQDRRLSLAYNVGRTF